MSMATGWTTSLPEPGVAMMAGANAGEAYIIYGKVGTDGTQFGTKVGDRQVLDTTGLAPTDGFILQGDMGGDELGNSVSGAGDVNGDGFDDLIVGAYQGDDGGARAGEAYVVYGGTHLGEVVSHDQTLVGGMVPTLPEDPTPGGGRGRRARALPPGRRGRRPARGPRRHRGPLRRRGRRRPRAGGRDVPPRRRRLGL